MRILSTIFLIASTSLAGAQSTITGNGTSYITSAPRPPTYTYMPKPDISAWELSEVVQVLLPALSCHHYFDDCGVVKRIEALPPEVRRHFARDDK